MPSPNKVCRHKTPVDYGKAKATSPAALPVSAARAAKTTQTPPIAPETDSESPPLALPYTWKFAVGGSSSFERALSAVMDKLDAMEDADDANGAGGGTRPAETPATISHGPPAPTPATDRGHAALSPRSSSPPPPPPPPADPAVDPLDRDISDRDVLRGLKTAVAAACDEDLDAWIRARTGLRLRRFLCDLRAFGDLEAQMGRAAAGAAAAAALALPGAGADSGPAQEASRTRGQRAEKRRLDAERERRRRNQAGGGCRSERGDW